jgi:NTE family protein
MAGMVLRATHNRQIFLVFFTKILACLVILLLLPKPIGAQDAGKPVLPEGHPRIGLVLSGGGARGAAHVGVIAVLEEMKIPIACIAGTSMGAIVGGLYAAGLSAAEMEQIVTSLEWNQAFRDKPLPRDLTFRRKQDAADYLIDFDLGIKDGRLTIPKGLLQGQSLNLILKSILLHTEEISEFDDLPVPFRAVATNIENGEAVILKSGELASAIRASMSIPGVFAPVELDGYVLVDGGVANNLPVDVVRQMDADVVIAVDIGTALSDRKKLVSSVGITSQLITIMIQRNTAERIRMLAPGRDILIQPDLGNITTGDFTRAGEAVAIGRKKAESMKQALAHLSVSEQQYAAYLVSQGKAKQPPPRIDFVELDNRTSLPDAVIASQIDLKPGETLDMAKLKRNIDRIYGIDMFERVDFRVKKKDKASGIVIEPMEKSWGPNYLRFGIGLEDNFKGSSTYALTAQFTKTGINRLAGEWRIETSIGDRPRIFTEFYQPVDDSLSYFLAANAEYYVRSIYDYNEGGDVTSQYRVNATRVGLDAGRQFGNWGEFRVGVRREHGGIKVRIGNHTGDSDPYDRGSVFASFAYSRLDNYVFPLSGTDASVVWENNLKALGSDIDMQALGVHWMTALTWKKVTLIPSLDIRTTLDNDDLPVQDTFPLGGFLNLSGYAADELYGRHTGLARLMVYREMFSAGLGFLNTPLYLGASVEAGNVWNRREDIRTESLIWAGSVFVGTRTFLGPIYLAYGQAQRDHSSLYLFLGQRF